MFSGKVTVKIEKDNNTVQYIKIIRSYDSSISLAGIKKAIDNGDVVFSFDPEDNPLIADGRDNTMKFKETFFIKALKDLKKAGAKMIVYDEEDHHEYKEFSTAKKAAKTKKPGKTTESVMEAIEQKWNLPQTYLDYLRTHPKSQEVEYEDEDEFETFPITLYGANDLIKRQGGYSYNPVEEKAIEDWDPNLIVIADMEADPFCIDISQKDSPVLIAGHGMGEWDFDEFCDSFEEFLEMLGVE